jgi:hypothetical protein
MIFTHFYIFTHETITWKVCILKIVKKTPLFRCTRHKLRYVGSVNTKGKFLGLENERKKTSQSLMMTLAHRSSCYLRWDFTCHAVT